MNRPSQIFLFCGKRKTGKSYITSRLRSKMGCVNCVVIKISDPIRAEWSKVKGASFLELMKDEELRDDHCREMISWSEEIRNRDSGHFCRAAIDKCKAHDKLFWIVSDVTHKSDIDWFEENFSCPIHKFRVEANDETREERGWSFVEGVDDSSTECDLDDFEDWERTLTNNSTEEIDPVINEIVLDLTKRRR